MSIKAKLFLVLCSVFAAAVAVGSNMAFKLNYTLLTNTDHNNINWVSVPYHSTATVAEGLCTQINANCANIATSVAYFDTATNSYAGFICGGTKGNFNIVPGRAIAVSVSAAGSSCWHPAHY